jgi:diacylglycerol kinase
MGIRQNFKYAFIGLRYILKHEKTARVHLFAAAMALLLGLLLHLSSTQWVAIFFAIIIVFLAEITNTALEKTLDLIEPREHPQVKIIKDMAAGAVLVTATGAAIIGVAVFGQSLLKLL